MRLRFGYGIGTVRPNGDPFEQGQFPPNAWGLQRLTNLNPLFYTTARAVATFISPEDAVWQDPTVAGYSVPFPTRQPVTSPSPVLPDLNMSGGALTYDLALHMDVHWAAIRRLQRHEL